MKYFVDVFDNSDGTEKVVAIEADYFDVDTYSFRESRQPAVTFHKVLSFKPYRHVPVAYFPQFINITSEEKK